MAQMYINYGSFAGWANKLDANNKNLSQDLHDIQKKINDLKNLDIFRSNASDVITSKITAMESKFQGYEDVVNSYVNFIKATADAYKNIEEINTKQASQFI